MANFKVLVTAHLLKEAKARLDRYDVAYKDKAGLYSEDEFKKAIRPVDALILGMDRLTANIIEASKKLRVVGRYGVGVDNVDLEACRRKGIIVTFTPVLEDAVAELTIGLMIALARRIVPASGSVRLGEWDPTKFIGVDLKEKTLGIIGLGRIGARVAEKAKGLGLKVIYFDIDRKHKMEESFGLDYETFDRLLSESDFISFHVPLTERTKGMIGQKEISKLKSSAYIINTSRGEVLDESALAEALRTNKIAGAALDTLKVEKPGSGKNLASLDNVIITPHIGSNTLETRRRMGETVVEDVMAVLEEKEPRFPYNL